MPWQSVAYYWSCSLLVVGSLSQFFPFQCFLVTSRRPGWWPQTKERKPWVPNQYSGNWALLSCKRFILFGSKIILLITWVKALYNNNIKSDNNNNNKESHNHNHCNHCYRHSELSILRLVLWEPTHGRWGRGRPTQDYIAMLKRDTGTSSVNEISCLWNERKVWRSHVVVRLRATKWVKWIKKKIIIIIIMRITIIIKEEEEEWVKDNNSNG